MPCHRAPPALDQNHLRHTVIPCWDAACTCMEWTNKCFFTKLNVASQIWLFSFWNNKLGNTIRMVESPALFSSADEHLNKNNWCQLRPHKTWENNTAHYKCQMYELYEENFVQPDMVQNGKFQLAMKQGKGLSERTFTCLQVKILTSCRSREFVELPSLPQAKHWCCSNSQFGQT